MFKRVIEYALESLEIADLLEQNCPATPAIQDVVNDASRSDSSGSRHNWDCTPNEYSVNWIASPYNFPGGGLRIVPVVVALAGGVVVDEAIA